jgi:phage gp45-like
MFVNPDFKIAKLEPSNVKIRLYGDVAVVTALITGATEVNGNTGADHTSWSTTVYVKRNGVWQKAVYEQTSTTPIPASEYTK